MSETALNPTTETTPAPDPAPDPMLLDGAAPRLGSTPITPPTAMGTVGTPTLADAPGAAPTLPVVSPVLTTPGSTMTTPGSTNQPSAEARFAANAQQFDVANLPTLPETPPATPAVIEDHPVTETEPLDDAPPEHPMAHLMPSRSKPTEASRRAAEARAAKKAKGKKIKMGIAAGTLVVSALVGPPLFSWLSNALSAAGDTSTEEPVG